MDYFQIVGYPLLLVAALEIILGLILLSHNPQDSPIHKSVAVFAFASAGYSLFGALLYLSVANGFPGLDLYARASWVGWLSIPAALQFLSFLKDEPRRARIIGAVLYPFWTVILLLTLFTDLVEPPGYRLAPYVDQHGPLENPARLVGGFLILWVVIEAFLLRRRVHGVKRLQLRHFFHGTIIFGVGGALLAAFIQVPGGFGLDPGLGAFFSFPWVVLTFYAVMRYSLFDLRVILSRTFSAIFIWIVFSLLHLWLTRMLEPVVGRGLSILLSISFIGLLFFGTSISKWVQARIQQFVVRDRHDYQRILRESINAVITILDQNELLNYLIESIRRGMGIDAVYLYWLSPNGKYSRRRGIGPLLDAGDEIVLADVAVRWLRQERQPVIRAELERILPEESSGGLSAYLRSIGIEIMVPMIYKNALVGVLVLGRKGGREPYLKSDIDLLEALAGHAAVAMENAQLYEEAKRVKESLRESEEKFRTLAQTLPAAIFIHRGGKFLYANPAGVRMSGYSMDEILNMDFWGVTHPDYRHIITDRGRVRLEGSEAPPQYEFKIVRKDGAERWVLMTANIIDYEGKSAVIGTIFDITERKKAEEEKALLYEETRRVKESLRESEEKFRTLANTLPAAVFIHRGGKFLYANPAAMTVTGYAKDELVNLDFWGVTHPDYRKIIIDRAQGRLHGDHPPPQYEFKIVRKDGRDRWVLMTAGTIEYEGQTAVIGTAFDITERKLAEQERAKLYEENMRQYQQRIEEEERHRREKEKILRELHDGIGGITTNISLLADMAKDSDSPPAIRKTLTTISTLAREGLADIRGFMHSLDARDMNWASLAAELRNQGSSMIEPHGISFTASSLLDGATPPPGSLFCLNLFKIYKEALTNIVKHAQARSVTVDMNVQTDKVVLAVSDDGIGCEERKGTGRGMSNMRSRTEELGGNFTITSGKGTMIQVELPLPGNYPARGMVL